MPLAARLATCPAEPASASGPGRPADRCLGASSAAHLSLAASAITEEDVRAVAAARRLRDGMFADGLFADPAWDMMLELFAASLAQRRVSTVQLIDASAVPPTTALRWIDKLEGIGVARRIKDPLDGRRIWVEMPAEAQFRMRAFFESCPARPRT